MDKSLWLSASLLLASGIVGLSQVPGPQAPSPASRRVPPTVNRQSFPAEQIRAGEARFATDCGSCHGRDARGSDTGPDLARSMLVAEDVRGDKIGPVVRAGRVEKGMPAFNLRDAELAAIVAFIHDQKTIAEALGGGRRSVDPSDLQTGNRQEGEKYFNGAGNCSKCHSPTGDLAGIAGRFQGLALLQRMLYPTSGRPAPKPGKVVVTLPSGEVINGTLVSRDEFTVVITDQAGARRTWKSDEAKFSIEDPLAGHFEQLGKYTDADMHNVLAYLQSLR
jgi:cytochrome c oxidase cbb3-type subunit 3